MNQNLRRILVSTTALAFLSLISWGGVSANQVQPISSNNQIQSVVQKPAKPQLTTQKVSKTQIVNRTAKYGFRKRPSNTGHRIPLNHYYGRRVHFNQIVKNQQGTFVKTKRGWLNYASFYQWYLAKGKVNVRVQLGNSKLYNQPAKTPDAQVISTVHQLNLVHHWVNANQVAYTNRHDVYYRFAHQNQQFWVPAWHVNFDLKALRGHNHRLEHALSVGEKLIGHSKYYESGVGYAPSIKRFDCSEFVRWVFLHAGVYIGGNTFTQIRNGYHVKASHMRRGDIFFFDDRDQGRLCHVGIYLGHHLFLHDSPDTNTGGVGVSSLNDPFWRPRFDHIVRRVI